MINKIKIILITFLFVLNSCSVSLFNMNEDIDKLNIKIVREDLNVYKDSVKIYISRYVNEKKVDDRIICQSNYKIKSESESYFSISFTTDILILDDYPLQFNSDSSLALFTETDLWDNVNSPSELYLIDLKNCSTTLIKEFESSSVSIMRLSPSGNNIVKIYTAGSPAKWVEDDKFILGTNDGIYFYDVKNALNSEKKMNVPINSNFQLVGDKLINQTYSSIYILDYLKRKKTDLFVESETIGLRKTENYLFFLKGWSLYRCDLEKLEEPIKIYEADNFIKNYWIISDDQFIIRSGDLTQVPNFDAYYYYNHKTREAVFIDKSSRVNDNYISADKKYFMINKKVIQLKHYEVLSVYDIEKKIKYDFDLETLGE